MNARFWERRDESQNLFVSLRETSDCFFEHFQKHNPAGMDAVRHVFLSGERYGTRTLGNAEVENSKERNEHFFCCAKDLTFERVFSFAAQKNATTFFFFECGGVPNLIGRSLYYGTEASFVIRGTLEWVENAKESGLNNFVSLRETTNTTFEHFD